jgi:dipeptidyl aminopeptidase/acylaminoacyl peptidase
MKKFIYLFVLTCHFVPFVLGQNFTMEQITSYPFPSELVASPTGDQLAWTANEQGLRNVYMAQAPNFSIKKVTDFSKDDGQEITSLQFSPNGKHLIFVRGGEHGSNWQYNESFNPTISLHAPQVEIWAVSLVNGEVKMLAEGDEPTVSPDGSTIAFIKNRQAWQVPIDGGKATQLFEMKGNIGDLSWSPNGQHLLFSVNRSTHSLIAIFDKTASALSFIEPSFGKDSSPRWAIDGKRIAFIRRPGGSPEPQKILEQRHSPWEIWVADVQTGKGNLRWKAPETLRGAVPTTHGGINLQWAANDQIVYLSYEDGWPHLYAMAANGGASRQLTKGNYMVEHISLSPNREQLLFSGNGGQRADDIDRRHIGRVTIADGKMEWLSQGLGIETQPVMLANGQVACLTSDAKRPMMPTFLDIKTQKLQVIGEGLLAKDFPLRHLVTPTQVIFKSSDGLTVHGQLFEKESKNKKKPAIVFVHGGPQRQMLLGWHYGDYYSNTYAINQFLADQGFVVLSVNFRLGIGYGYEFHKAPRTYGQGAEEYLDIKAAGEFLKTLPQVDPDRIGIYGGSYGGYLTALALGKDSNLFKVGVDIHGVHELSSRIEMPDGYESAPDREEAVKTAFYSSPLAYLETWTSPVLFIHGDDDRNVQVSQTVDLVRRFQDRKMKFEYLMIPNDSHHWMKYSNQVKVNSATAEFLKRHLITNK